MLLLSGGSALAQPALGLVHEKPVDLLESLDGAQAVVGFLARLQHGVYT
jgi:uncharacterized protein (DUF2384 family)